MNCMWGEPNLASRPSRPGNEARVSLSKQHFDDFIACYSTHTHTPCMQIALGEVYDTCCKNKELSNCILSCHVYTSRHGITDIAIYKHTMKSKPYMMVKGAQEWVMR